MSDYLTQVFDDIEFKKELYKYKLRTYSKLKIYQYDSTQKHSSTQKRSSDILLIPSVDTTASIANYSQLKYCNNPSSCDYDVVLDVYPLEHNVTHKEGYQYDTTVVLKFLNNSELFKITIENIKEFHDAILLTYYTYYLNLNRRDYPNLQPDMLDSSSDVKKYIDIKVNQPFIYYNIKFIFGTFTLFKCNTIITNGSIINLFNSIDRVFMVYETPETKKISDLIKKRIVDPDEIKKVYKTMKSYGFIYNTIGVNPRNLFNIINNIFIKNPKIDRIPKLNSISDRLINLFKKTNSDFIFYTKYIDLPIFNKETVKINECLPYDFDCDKELFDKFFIRNAKNLITNCFLKIKVKCKKSDLHRLTIIDNITDTAEQTSGYAAKDADRKYISKKLTYLLGEEHINKHLAILPGQTYKVVNRQVGYVHKGHPVLDKLAIDIVAYNVYELEFIPTEESKKIDEEEIAEYENKFSTRLKRFFGGSGSNLIFIITIIAIVIILLLIKECIENYTINEL